MNFSFSFYLVIVGNWWPASNTEGRGGQFSAKFHPPLMERPGPEIPESQDCNPRSAGPIFSTFPARPPLRNLAGIPDPSHDGAQIYPSFPEMSIFLSAIPGNTHFTNVL